VNLDKQLATVAVPRASTFSTFQRPIWNKLHKNKLLQVVSRRKTSFPVGDKQQIAKLTETFLLLALFSACTTT
jgi:hypothetical protein